MSYVAKLKLRLALTFLPVEANVDADMVQCEGGDQAALCSLELTTRRRGCRSAGADGWRATRDGCGAARAGDRCLSVEQMPSSRSLWKNQQLRYVGFLLRKAGLNLSVTGCPKHINRSK